MDISWIQAALLGIMSCTAASTIACFGTTIGNYTLNRPLIASVFVGIILGDVQGCIMIAIPMQIIYIALATPGGIVGADLRAVSYIGIPLAYVMARNAGVAFDSEVAMGFSSLMATATGTIGISMFYGTAMFNLVWQHIGWVRLEKNDFKVLGKVNVVYPLISHFFISFIPVMLLTYHGANIVQDIALYLGQNTWYVQAMIQIGNCLPCVGIAILLKSVATRAHALIMFAFGFVLAGAANLSLISTACVGAAFALLNYQFTKYKHEKEESTWDSVIVNYDKTIKSVSKKALQHSFWRWFYGDLTCFTHEHMETFGYMWAMYPIIDELYDTVDEKAQHLHTYSPFFNTEPQIGAVIVGVTVGLEEARANGAKEIDDEMINGIRASLMGPLAGLGDSLIVSIYIPILLGIAIGLAEGGSIIGPLFYIVVWIFTSIFFQHWLFHKGYEIGASILQIITSEKAKALRSSIIMMGQLLVGAMAVNWINLQTKIVITTDSSGAMVTLQDKLDSAFPKGLPFVFVLLCWWLMTKKKMRTVNVLLLMMIIGLVGSLIGFFGTPPVI